jgi:sec-independent protein translocase protein TatC
MDEIKGGDSSSYEQHPDIYPDDPYGGVIHHDEPKPADPPRPASGGGTKPPPPPPPPDEEDEDDGMLRMSFMEHLEDLRKRIIRGLVGFGVIFVLCVAFCDRLWLIVQAPATEALQKIGIKDGKLVTLDPMEGFMIIWVWTPVVASLFLGAPWILYKIWAFIAPGLYPKERRWAIPFVFTTAGLFIGGGLFAYFIAFRYGLAFLLGLGGFAGVVPMVSIDRYFSLFVDVMLGVALVFEMPVVIFFLTLLRLASPRFLVRHSRYAILAIVILAAIVTPTPDIFNMMLFAVPMVLLYFVGVFAGYLLVLKREGRRFPWGPFLKWFFITVLILGGMLAGVIVRFHLHWIKHWPYLAR